MTISGLEIHSKEIFEFLKSRKYIKLYMIIKLNLTILLNHIKLNEYG